MASYKSPSLSVCVGYDVTSPTCRSRGAVLVVEPGIGKAALRAITVDRYRGHQW